MTQTIVFTDGSSRGNPGPGGWGAIVCFDVGSQKRVRELGGGDKKTTNNRMELTALIEALTFVATNTERKENQVIVYTDSEYVKKGATEWARAWQNNNWRTKANSDVLNKDLWQKVIPLMEALTIEINVIPGHAGIEGNERCDVIATSFADGEKIKLYDGDILNYDGSFQIKLGAEVKKASSGTGKAYSYVSLVQGKVAVHATWKECEMRVKGKSGVRFKKALSKNDEAEIVRDFQKSS